MIILICITWYFRENPFFFLQILYIWVKYHLVLTVHFNSVVGCLAKQKCMLDIAGKKYGSSFPSAFGHWTLLIIVLFGYFMATATQTMLWNIAVSKGFESTGCLSDLRILKHFAVQSVFLQHWLGHWHIQACIKVVLPLLGCLPWARDSTPLRASGHLQHNKACVDAIHCYSLESAEYNSGNYRMFWAPFRLPWC